MVRSVVVCIMTTDDFLLTTRKAILEGLPHSIAEASSRLGRWFRCYRHHQVVLELEGNDPDLGGRKIKSCQNWMNAIRPNRTERFGQLIRLIFATESRRTRVTGCDIVSSGSTLHAHYLGCR